MATPPLEELARESRFIFRGTVERLNEATMPAVPVNEHTAVVRVDEIIRAPDLLSDLTNQEITVQLREAAPMQVRQQALFFTNPWLYGTGIAVQEVGRQEVARRGTEAERSRVREQVASIAQGRPDEALQARLASAVIVVMGRVYNTRPATFAGSPPVTEHDPAWWEALIAVEEVLKGAVPPVAADAVQKGAPSQPTIVVLFANSQDVVWFQAPKLRPGQEGIWLLHRDENIQTRFPVYVVLDPLDAQPKDQLGRIRSLLQTSPPAPS